jgi:hypothetical protein
MKIAMKMKKKMKTTEMNQEKVRSKSETEDLEEDHLDPKTDQNHPSL